MVGGIVIEVCDIPKQPDWLWVNTASRQRPREQCSVLVAKSVDAEQIQIGDSLWWQGGVCYWTPADKSRIEVQLAKIGGSGVTYESVCQIE